MGLTAAQIEIRRSGVTASDVRVLTGYDPYGRTVHDLYAAKVFGVDSYRDTEATRIGLAIEPIVIAETARKKGLQIAHRVDMTVRHPAHPTRIATPDAFLLGPELIEAKVVGFHAAHEWGESEVGEAPDWVVIQVAWQMIVTEAKRVHVGALIGTEVRTYTVQRDPALDQVLIEQADRFWTDHILAKRPPDVDGSEGSRRMLKAQWPRSNGTMIQAGPHAESIARRYFAAKHVIDAAEKEKELASQELIALIGDNDGITGDGWRGLLKLREATDVAYRRDAYRHWDIRAVKGKKK
jgi:putative phage-type endonuclease